MLCCDWFTYTSIPQSFATAKNRSRSPAKVRHIGWHLADAREYLSTSVASTVSRRIYIYIHPWFQPIAATIIQRLNNRLLWKQVWSADMGKDALIKTMSRMMRYKPYFVNKDGYYYYYYLPSVPLRSKLVQCAGPGYWAKSDDVQQLER